MHSDSVAVLPEGMPPAGFEADATAAIDRPRIRDGCGGRTIPGSSPASVESAFRHPET